MKYKLQTILMALMTIGAIHHAAAQGTAFTYQGRLNDSGQCANGKFDMQFELYGAASGGSPIGANLTVLPPTEARQLTASISTSLLETCADARTLRNSLSWPQGPAQDRYHRIARFNELAPMTRRQAIDIPREKRIGPGALIARSEGHRAIWPGSRRGTRLGHIWADSPTPTDF